MNIIIIGCGKTGSRLARELDERGYDVSVVDRNEDNLDRLGNNFSGLAVCGVPADPQVLKNAGCENADIAVVVTPNDNENVMVAQIMKIEFDIEEVYVRVLDPSREAIFRKFGLRTVCPTRFEATILFNLATKQDEEIETLSMGNGSIQFESEKTDKKMIGKSPAELSSRPNEMPFAIIRKTGQVLLCNDEDLVIEEGDQIVFAVVLGG